MDAYTKELRRIMSDDTPPKPTKMSCTQIEADIASITNQLKGPLSNPERLWLVETRRELRKQLAAAS